MNNPNEKPTTNRFRPHPVYILSNLGRYLFLLIIPLLRGLFHVLKNGFSLKNGFHLAAGFSAWLVGAWLDLLSVLTIITLSILLWYFFTVEPTDTGLCVQKGLFRRSSYFLPACRFTCLTVARPFYLAPLGGVYLRVDTPGGNFKDADLIILLRRRDCDSLLSSCFPDGKLPRIPFKSYRPRSLYVFVLAAITSNSFAGVVLITTVLTQLGTILGKQFSELVYGTFEDVAKTLAFGIPPAAAALAYILLFGYLFAFAANLFRHANFAVRRQPSRLEINAGLITKRTYLLDTGKISYMDIRRTLITVLLGLSSVFLNTVGYGKYKDDVSALIPCATKKQLVTSLKLLLPEFKLSARSVTPCWRSAFRYTANSLFCCGGILAASVISSWLFPAWIDLIRWVAFLCFCPSCWFLAVRIVDLFSAGISYREGYFTLRYSKGFTLHTIIIPREKIASINATQSIFQRRSGRCNLYLFSYTEGLRVHKVRDLKLEEVERLFHLGGVPAAVRSPRLLKWKRP